ncbi:MAG TPA: hypothetical protein VN811_14010 [Thermoanaerobaculia bacterium]|nr:hypothetical protein [Thermoanaerobaculia bacterium]HXT52154.1 hypothetical protein [Thermoanaerobaculia bacterium]
MYHASIAFSGEIVPILELALTLLAALLVLWRPRRLEAWLRRGWRALAAVGPRRAVLASALGALLASAATMLWLGFPVPFVTDEHGYLFTADTFAHGRLTNPTPRVPVAFEAIHVMVRPSYATKYPPAPALPLAAGQLLGHAGIGVCLTAALFAAACCWFLQGWLPPPWPLVGAALATLKIGIGSYWGQSYWGGAVTAIGAFLLYGALPRLFRGHAGAPRLAWAPLALGVFLLANSRPFEGALAALPAAVVVAVALARRIREWWKPAAALTLALATGAALTAAHNRAVTGDPLQLPYRLYVATYGVDVLGPYVAPPPPVRYSSPALAFHLARSAPRPHTASAAIAAGAGHFARMAYFVCGLPLMVFAAFTVRRLPRTPATRWKLFALLCAALPAAVHSVTAWWGPHYSAAATGPLLLLAMTGMRETAGLRWRGRRLGAAFAVWLAFATLLVRLPLTLVELPAFRPDPDHPSRFLRALEADAARRSARDLIVVDDRLRRGAEWVLNPADLASAPILWIQDLGPEVTRQVATAYAPRRVFALEPGEGERALPRLRPLPELDTPRH